MSAHLRANLVLLGLTVVLCCIIYPGLLWVIGQTAFHDKAEGSLIVGPDGKTVVGSSLIGQQFSDDKYFQPRPSAAGSGYDASASSGSNYAASNPKLRGRIAQQLGPIVKYKEGSGQTKSVQEDIEAWFSNPLDKEGQKRDLVREWTKQKWVRDAWAGDHKELLKKWAEKSPKEAGEAKTAEDLAPLFLESFAAAHPGEWPSTNKKENKFEAARKGEEVQSIFFDMWAQAHPEKAASIDPVPADMVMASGSGLDPHITLRNATWQLNNRVAAARAKTGVTKDKIEKLLEERAFTPLSGLTGERLINVLEVNIALDKLEQR